MIGQALLDTKAIAILRGLSGDNLFSMANALYQGGIRLAEVTLNSEDALESIATLRELYNGKMHIGAGTVIDRASASEALSAGAEFIVMPNVDKDAILYCAEKEVTAFPGALTPTEILAAIRLGSRYVKVFPLQPLGPSYLENLLGPLKGASLVAVGGVNADNAASYLKSGAVAVGVGGSLCRVPPGGNFEAVTLEAVRLLKACRSHTS